MWMMVFALALLVLWPTSARADREGWDYLIDKLVADGFARGEVEAVFADTRVVPFGGLEYDPERRHEPSAMYRRFLGASAIAAARRCRIQHAVEFESAGERYGVSADVIASILFVETACGRNTGSNLVFVRLARLAMANAPETLQHNMDRFSDADGVLDVSTAAQLRNRAASIENTFYPEVRALLQMSEQLGIDPLDVRGSGSGAFGYPQFLPSSYLRFGADGNGDGHISLYDFDDAAASCARYLASHGWHPGLSQKEKRDVIWYYNHSKSYVDSVLTLAGQIGRPAPPPRKKPVKAKAAKGKSAKKGSTATTSKKNAKKK